MILNLLNHKDVKESATDMAVKSPNIGDDIALKTEHLTKIFDSKGDKVAALQDVNFTVKRGEFVSIMGPSGSGKSTLLNIIGALDKPTSGKVFINGFDIFAFEDTEIATMRNRLIGYVFQSYNLVNRTTVEMNVKLPAIIAGMSTSEANFRAKKILETLGIADKAKQKPANLSGGQQQRVAIARCLINNPAIILADEPTGNLDTKTGADIFDMLKELSNKFRRTIIMVTHNPELAESTHRTVMIKDGRIESDVKN
jgi:putative ABC transport system ATP-binding protein